MSAAIHIPAALCVIDHKTSISQSVGLIQLDLVVRVIEAASITGRLVALAFRRTPILYRKNLSLVQQERNPGRHPFLKSFSKQKSGVADGPLRKRILRLFAELSVRVIAADLLILTCGCRTISTVKVLAN